MTLESSYTAGRNQIFRSLKHSGVVMESHGRSHGILHQGCALQEPWEALRQPLVLSRCWRESVEQGAGGGWMDG